ncbi:hypothetical protein [Bacillus cereus]|uniref:hypothetical protein n=1 Tax=Bacillus cereus TaxID=1396 RepID=UPI0018F7B96F|nr:hypothetical protein [Bacillus cereus]MBJ8024997.1 hypothetical protein [Bacillus cereus]MBJ8037473.1 hypothetical protein [Bacillus cereus]
MKKFIQSIIIASVLSLGLTILVPVKGYAEEFENSNELILNNLEENDDIYQPTVAPLIPAIIAVIMRLVPTALKAGARNINISKFTTKVAGKLKDPKSGWTIQRDRGNNPHGGSFWKLFDKSGKRIATLDKNGKILRK